MPTVFCDNHGCIFIDEDGFCDCDKLDIVGGECMGSVHGGRSVTESDTCEKLKAENKKLRVDWESERDYANQMEAIAERLKAENAKLRKYAKLYVGVVKAGGCDLCPYCEDFETCEDADAYPISEGCALYMEMRELGIGS